MNRPNPSPKKPNKARIIAFIIVVALVVLGVGTVLALHHGAKKQGVINSPAKPATTASQNTKGEPAPSTPAQPEPTTQPGDNKSNEGGGQTADPSTPLQDPANSSFAGNHHPGPTETVQSVCNTSPGASCTISFTKDGATKSLPTQTTDRGGATYWTWSPQGLGLSPGTWHITATATLGSQTKTASDVLDLMVGS